MLTTIFFLIVFGGVIFAFYNAEKDSIKAFQCDFQNKHKEALYYYAVATVTSCFFKDNCREQIASLWKEHGPFDYSDLYNSAANIKNRENFISREAIVEIIKSSATSL